MKRFIFFILAVMIFLVGCTQSKKVNYNVDPDQVFGQHYEAKDFGLWYVLDFNDAQYERLVFEAINRLPKEKQMAWNTKGGLQLPVSDTTVFMQALREGKKLVNSEGKKLLPCWLLVSESDSIYQFNLLYGDRSGKPIINGTQVKNVSVQKSTYTGQYEVLMRFDMKTADFWQKFTAENVDNRIGMMLASDRLLSVPQIMCEIAGGACSVSGPTEEECKAIAVILQGDK